MFFAVLMWVAAASARTAPWSFQADFQHGLNGWMSYPLPQDIGFDPTLSVEQSGAGPVLIREVVSAGQASLSTGVIRPLHFVADTGTRVSLRYSASWPSSATLKLSFAGVDGRLYGTALPASGEHEAMVTGRQLGVPASGVAIEAIVLLSRAMQPAAGASNRFELRAFQLDAARPAEVPLAAPRLLSDNDRTYIAAQVIDPAVGLTIELAAGPSPVQVTLRDPSGREAAKRALKAPGRYSIPLHRDSAAGLWKAHLETAQTARDFSFLVIGHLPDHPRVLFSAARLSQLASVRQQIHEQAGSLAAKLPDIVKAGREVGALPPGKTLRPSYEGELTNYFQSAEAASNAIAYNALDYALTADSSALASARRDLLAMARWPVWTPPRFSSHGMRTYYETGIIAQRLALAYDLIVARLTPAERREVAGAFWTKSIDPALDEYFRYNRMPAGASNWMSNSLGGALAAAIAIADEVPGWRAREGVAFAQLIAAFDQNLHGLFPGDGSETEPAGYEHFAMQGISWGTSALRSLGIRPAGSDEMLQGFWWPDYAMVRSDLVLDTGDFNGEFRSLSGFAFDAEFSANPAARAFYDRLNHAGRITDLLDLLCCSRAAGAVRDAPLSRVFAERGSAVLRSGWSPDATVISLRAGPWFNHEHHDQGTFQVAAFGTRLISEAGYASYYLDPNYPGYYTQAAGHNTVLLDGNAFSQGEYDGPFWKALNKHASFTRQLLSPGFDYLAADLAPAYQGGVSTYTRQYLFLAPDVLIVRDNLRSQQPHLFTWLLHAAAGAEVENHGREARIVSGDAVADVRSDASGPAWQIREMPLPASVSQIPGNVELHPGAERKKPHREALCLTSPKSDHARFEVTMQFHRDPAAKPDSTFWALFREGAGDLRSHGLSADAAVFAGRDNENWMAIGARSVRDSEILFTSDAAANVVWNGGDSGTSLDLSLDGPAMAAIRVRRRVASVSIDGAPVRYSEQNGRVQLPPLKKGEHRVWIATRAAFQ